MMDKIFWEWNDRVGQKDSLHSADLSTQIREIDAPWGEDFLTLF
jgi:hypothetical protein